MMLLAKTTFPSFTFDRQNKFVSSSTPELDDTSCSSDEEAEAKVVQKRFEQHQTTYKTKEDQDVAVFMSLANRMDVSSLVFLLQGHAKALNLPAAAQHQAAQRISQQQQKPSSSSSSPKKFRFAFGNHNHVKSQIHVVESVKHYTDLWWSDEDMKHMRSNAIQDVKYYRKFRPDFAQSVEILANSSQTTTSNTTTTAADASTPWMRNATVETHMKKMMNEGSYARGLEVHIVPLLSNLRRETVQAVLEEQAECRSCGDSHEITIESLRQQSLAYTLQSVTFAMRMAQCDQIEALKASLSSRWEAEGAAAASPYNMA